jgi:hypothetical protein
MVRLEGLTTQIGGSTADHVARIVLREMTRLGPRTAKGWIGQSRDRISAAG